MKQIIEEVLQAEERVSAALKQAREKAAEIVRATEKETSEKVAGAREKAREIMQTTIEEAKKEAEHIREEKLKQMNQKKEALLKSNPDVTDALVDNICRIVVYELN